MDKGLVDLVKQLSESDSENKIFDNQAQCLTFAASYGYINQKREVIDKAPTSMVDPIHPKIFENGHMDTFFDLLALAAEDDSKVLGDDDNAVDRRATIFEEYAKGGLILIKNKLRGHLDYLAFFMEASLENSKQQLDDDVEHFDPSILEIK